MSRRNPKESTCLIDHVVGSGALGPPRALLATTFELGADFVEHDFLPSLLSLSTKDDRSTRARLQLEEQLAQMDVAALLMDAECYRARPCSLRVHVTARRARAAGRLHAKVTLIVHDDAVRLLVGSANLTDSGYRSNREVALSVSATAKKPEAATLIAQALESMPEVLETWWSSEAEKARKRALKLLSVWRSPVDEGDGDRFVWSGPERPLWRQFAEQWPKNEPLQKLFVVSPFWSEEHEHGQLGGLLRALRERGASTEGAKVNLLTNAVAEKEGTFLPQAHPSFATFNLCSLGIEATLHAVDPQVNEEGFERDGRLRNLHAKVLIAAGPTTTLAYVGSANFTTRGWCFGSKGRWNIEAGVLLRREGRAARGLLDLVPATIGKAQRLDGRGSLVFREIGREQELNEWPQFIDIAELAPDQANLEELLLRIEFVEGEAPEHARLSTSPGPDSTILWDGKALGQSVLEIPLSPELLRILLMRKEVMVEWTGMRSATPFAFPLNVAAAARVQLPFSSSGQLIGESALVAFYQGRLSFEDLFPGAVDGDLDLGDAAVDATTSAVDTSKILSYQIRAFVEALPGIRQEIERSSGTVNSIRLAMLGPVSPVALGRMVEDEVKGGRSPIAGAFQLSELVLCLRQVKRPAQLAEEVLEAWDAALHEAEQKLLAALERVHLAAPTVRESTEFRNYSTLLNPPGGAA
jgi:hypothetical protein